MKPTNKSDFTDTTRGRFEATDTTKVGRIANAPADVGTDSQNGSTSSDKSRFPGRRTSRSKLQVQRVFRLPVHRVVASETARL